MSTKKLLKFFDGLVPKANILKQLKEEQIAKIATQTMYDYNSDCDSMTKWNKSVEEGRKLCEMEYKPRQTPFKNASNYKTSSLMQAALQFSDRVSYEILKPGKLVNLSTEGSQTDEREAIKKRLLHYLNWQLDFDFIDWKDTQEKLIYELPHSGTVFKKIYFCPREQKLVSELVTYPNFAVDNSITSLKNLRRFSEIFYMDENVIEENIRSKLWSNLALNEDSSDDTHKNTHKFIEQHSL